MNDTDPTVEATLAAMLEQRTPGDRMQMALAMFSGAVALARAGVCADEPGLPEPEVRIRVLRRLYADDLDPADLRAVEQRIRALVK